jgi:hypothetical protein
MDSAMLTLVITLAVASIVMVVAMVRFSMAIVAAPERTAARAWGLIYLAAWGAIVFVIVQAFAMENAGWPRAIAAATLVAGGWGTFQAFWVWLWLALERTNARATGRAAALAPAKERICRRAGQLAIGGLIAVALAVAELGYVRMLIDTMIAPGHRAVATTITVAVAGWALLIIGSLRLVLRQGEPMSHAEIEEDLARDKFRAQGRGGLLRFSRSAYRHFGPAEGAKAEQELSITAMANAWRSGEWRRQPQLLSMFMMTAGGLMMFYGGFGIAIVSGPLFVKILCGAVLAYATFQLVAAIRRATPVP